MQWKWNGAGEAAGPGGLPQPVTGLEEALQNGAMAVSLARGSFLYGPELGSGLRELDPEEEHSGERARALAEEALLGLAGTRVKEAWYEEAAGRWRFVLETPQGEGQVTAPGKESGDGNL